MYKTEIFKQNRRRLFAVVFVLLCLESVAFCQYSISGKILDKKTGNAVEYANVMLGDREVWTRSDERGEFTMQDVAKGEALITVSCLGYAKRTFSVTVLKDTAGIVFLLPVDNLLLEEVVISSKSQQDEMSTSYIIDRAGLDHIQMSGITDALSLLPGGRTNSEHLTTNNAQRVFLRSISGEQGNSTFGTAVEVDGVRLSNNASMTNAEGSSYIYGIDTRNIMSSNISSIEVITGVASVEYGDMSNGIVKVNTGKGKSPLRVEAMTKPNTKQLSLSKGFALRKAGVLNVNMERTRFISDLASPYTAYDRNTLSVNYSATVKGNNNRPLSVEAGVTGNVGGYESKKDPDAFLDTYTKERDNTLRAYAKLNMLMNKSWITSLEVSATANYSDKFREENTRKSSSSSIAAIHGREEGYFVATDYDANPNAPIVLIPAGYWYELRYMDNRPVDAAANVKAKWVRKFGRVVGNLMLGADFKTTGNGGRGEYYDDLRYAASGWREFRFDQMPWMNNVAAYAEEKLSVTLNSSSLLQATAGLRSDVTLIEHSDYKAVNSLSPRMNVKYTFRGKSKAVVERLTLRAGWGKSVKLPSFTALYPEPAYSDKLAFAPGAMADGTIFYAYHILPYTSRYNPGLKWQYVNQTEAGVEAKLKGVSISLSLYSSKTSNAYKQIAEYNPFTYRFTDQRSLEGSAIPSADRQYEINRETGIVRVFDRTGQRPAETLASAERHTFKTGYTYINVSPSVRRGVEWIADFGTIRALRTSFRIDGHYYYYRGTEENPIPYSPVSQMMADGNPYKYVGFFVGGNNASNGSVNKRLNMNLTVATHIPAIRLIVSLRIEGSLYHNTQRLSEYGNAQRSFTMDSREDYFPSESQAENVYNRDSYVGLYPLYYVSLDDMETKIPFAETFMRARDNDRALYNELSKLVVKSNTDYFFNAAKLSGFYSANISLTKELGNFASISFNAVNFTNNMQLINSSDNNIKSTLYESRYIPYFYYGLSLRIKL
jgi:hypothetical protein